VQSDPFIRLCVTTVNPLKLSVSGPSGRSVWIQGTSGQEGKPSWQTSTILGLYHDPTVWTDTQACVEHGKLYSGN